MANKQFGETLRQLRNNRGYTQQQVADLLELKNKSTLGSWEVGKSEPDGYTLLRLCKIYEVQDIYTAFGNISLDETQIPDNMKVNYSINEQNLIRKYRNLDDKYKYFIDNQIDQLLKIQEK